MARNNSRDVRLGLAIDVSGDDDVDALSGSLRGLGTAGAALPAAFTETAAAIDRATTKTRELREVEGAARIEVRAEAAALAAKRDELARLRAESDRAARSTAEFVATERALKLAQIEGATALRQKRQALAEATAAARTAAAAESGLRAEYTAAAAAYRQIGSAATSAGNAARTSLAGVGEQLRTIQQAAAAVVGGQLLGGLIGDIGRTADAYAGLSARIKIATGDNGSFATSLQGVFDIAQRTGTAVDDVGSLFTKLVTAGKQLNLSNADALRLTESITQATALSGGSAQSANAAIVQFSQGLSAGTLRGEELNSVLEQSPRLARALADGLGVATGQLKKLGETGALTSAQVIAALQGQSAALQAEFDQLPPTIGRAITSLSNNWTQYIGSVDKATGASTTAARAITAIGNNLETLGALLLSAGKAATAYAAINLARSFIDTATAARASAVAVAAQTVAVEANTVATRANALASATAAAGAGRFASLLGSIKLISLVGVVTNLREIGTAIGEGAAKLAGYDKASKELERTQRADEAARRANAQATAELAQKLQLASDASFGFTAQSRKLVGEFNTIISKGGEVSTALDAVTKALDLGSLDGIRSAGIALDDLARKGLVSGAQVRDALAAALKNEDLAVFRTNAQAAFDGSEQGARRLQAAIDAITNESLRRAGTSLDELSTGFSRTATSALNDFDALAQGLDDLKVTSNEAGRALASSLDKALAAASTERAVAAVVDRLVEMGETGRVSGEQVAAGLEKARQKLDDLKPGINSLDEALRAFGLQTEGQIQATAGKLASAYQQIASSARISLADQRRAFDQWATAAIAANRGIEPSAVAVARAILEIREAAAEAGKGIEEGTRRGGRGVDELSGKVGRLRDQLTATAGSLSSLLEARNRQIDLDAIAGARKSGADSAELGRQATEFVNSPAAQLDAKRRRNQLSADDLPAARQNLDAASFNLQTAQRNQTQYSFDGFTSILRQFNEARQLLEDVEGAAARAAPTPATVTPTTVHRVEISMDGTKRTVNTASANDARSLTDLLASLGEASRRAGL